MFVLLKYLKSGDKMISKFNTEREISFNTSLEIVELYSSCLQLYLTMKNEQNFVAYLQTFCSEEIVEDILKQIHIQLKTLCEFNISAETTLTVIEKVKQVPESLLSFTRMQNKLFETYNVAKPYLNKRDIKFAEIFFSSKTETEMVQKACEELEISENTVFIYKNKLCRQLNACHKNPEKWVEKKVQEARIRENKKFSKLQTRMVETYQIAKNYLSEEEIKFADIFFSSKTETEMVQKACEELEISENAISIYKNKLCRQLNACRKNPEEWIEKKEKGIKTTKNVIGNRNFAQLLSDVQTTYDVIAPYLTNRELQLANVVLSSKSYEDFMERVKMEMHIESSTLILLRRNLISRIRCYQNYGQEYLLNRACQKRLDSLMSEEDFSQFQKEMIGTYQIARPYFKSGERIFGDIFFSSKNNNDLIKKAHDQMNICEKSIHGYKSRLRRELKTCSENSELWIYHRMLKQRSLYEFKNIQLELQEVYPFAKPFLTELEQEFLEIMFSSLTNEEFIKNAQEQLAMDPSSISKQELKLHKELLECKNNYRDWVEKRKMKSYAIKRVDKYFK